MVFCHLAALVIRLLKNDGMPFVDYHGKEALSFQITVAIVFVVAGIAVFCIIGPFLMPIIGLADLILSIMACVVTSKGEYYKYPWALRLIK